MGFLEFVYLIGCGVSFFCAVKELGGHKSEKKKDDAEFLALIIVSAFAAVFSWAFVIYNKYFNEEKQK